MKRFTGKVRKNNFPALVTLTSSKLFVRALNLNLNQFFLGQFKHHGIDGHDYR